MWDPRYLKRIDFRTVPIVLTLMAISIMVILSTTSIEHGIQDEIVISSMVKNQLRAFGLGIFVYIFLICFDYRKLREWTWFFYVATLIMLLGLYFAPPIHNVRRWYRFAFLPFDIQPSEYAKLVVVLTLSWFLEKKMHLVERWKTFFQSGIIVFLPFVLILKQPDLGTALILGPISLVIFYFGGVKKQIIKGLMIFAAILLAFVLIVFLGIVSHDDMRPFFLKFIKEYQYERLNPNTYHQKAGQTAIALGSFFGSGFLKSEFTGYSWLPYAYTDSVFPAFTEEFGFVGALLLLTLFYALIYYSFAVSKVANDHFGKLLASGIAVYLAMHVIINIGMMCGFLPITGVPLVLVSYGGSSVLSTMIALGLLQSIYARRYAFS
jgi:rod shape determining protein RodA